MAAGQTGLGKGLSALIRETNVMSSEIKEVHSLPIKDIVPNKDQPRRTFLENELEELASSIKSQGLLQPILVRPLGENSPGKYEIVAGERRWRAAKRAGLVEIPVFVRSLTDEETLTAALIENIQRENLNPIEEAVAIQTLKDSFRLSQEELATRLGKSRSAIANSVRLLALPEGIQDDIIRGVISAGHARALLSISCPETQKQLQERIVTEQLSVREAEGLASTWKNTGTLCPIEGESALQPAEHSMASHKTLAKAKPQSAVMLNIQEQICQALQAEVKVSGKETKGKISITYKSKEELEALLKKMTG